MSSVEKAKNGSASTTLGCRPYANTKIYKVNEDRENHGSCTFPLYQKFKYKYFFKTYEAKATEFYGDIKLTKFKDVKAT
jgi:hypothetical protein